jgi:hypothetical protein
MTRPLDPLSACRRLVENGEDLDRVLAGTHNEARAELIRGVIAMLRPLHDRRGWMSLDDLHPDVAVEILVARAQVAGGVW